MGKKVNWKLNLICLWFSQIVIMAGFSAMIPFIPLFIKGELGIVDVNKLAMYISLFNSCGTAGYAIFCPIWGWLGDKFGIKPMLLRGTFVTSIFFPMMGYVSSPEMLIFLRFITASCAGTTAASQIMVARNTPDDKQGFAQGVLSTAIWGGSMLGNVVGGFIIHYYSYRHAFWLCGIMYALAGLAILPTQDGEMAAPAVKKREIRHGLGRLLPDFSTAIWIMLAMFLLMGVVRQFEVPYIALRVEALSSPDRAAYLTGIISAAVCAGAIISGAANGYLADKLSVRNMLFPVFIISGLALMLQGLCASVLVFAIARVLLYFAAGGLQPILQKVLSSVTPANRRGAAFGFSTCFSSIGGIFAFMLGGCIMPYSLNMVFVAGGLVYLLCLPIMRFALKKAMNRTGRNG